MSAYPIPTPQNPPSVMTRLPDGQLSLAQQLQMAQAQQAQQAQGVQPPPGVMPSVGMPSLPPPTQPNVVDPSSPQGRMQRDSGELQRLQTSGTGIDQITHPVDPTTGLPTTQQPSLLRRFGGVMAKIGNVGADLALGRGAGIIPGTDLHHQMLMNNQQGLVNNDLGDQEKQAQTTLLNAQPELKQQAGEIAQLRAMGYLQHVGDQGAHYQDQNQVAQENYRKNLAAAGYAVDESDPTGKTLRPLRYEEMSPQQQAGIDLKGANEEEAAASAALKKAQNDPSSPAFRLAQARLANAERNSSAATLRAQAYMGNYLQGAFNTGLNGQTLPGAPQIENAGGVVTTVGTKNASTAVKAQANVAKFNDVHGALDSIEQTGTQLVQSGGSLNSPGVIYAMQHVSGTPSEFAQSLDKAHLSPAERHYVIALQAGRENIQALRGAVGSGVSDSQIDRLENMIPNGSTPDLNYLLNQTGQIRQTADRLGKGVTTVSGGTGVRGGNANNGPGSGAMIRAIDPQGVLHEAPAGTPLPAGWKAQ